MNDKYIAKQSDWHDLFWSLLDIYIISLNCATKLYLGLREINNRMIKLMYYFRLPTNESLDILHGTKQNA